MTHNAKAHPRPKAQLWGVGCSALLGVCVIFLHNAEKVAIRILQHDEVCPWSVPPWIPACA